MKTGIIIVFHNYENDINTNQLINYCHELKSIQFCFVNNDSKDNTYLLLEDIKDLCDNVSIVNIKKFKSDISAVKSGARYMFNHFKLQHIGYINSNVFNKQSEDLSQVMKTIGDHQETIIKYDKEQNVNQHKRKTLFQKLFSVVDYLAILEQERHVENFHYQSKL
ncbi:hypothetical protein [Psychroserpens damuponensis]|uniref:hypothetical protein n=1 Tax=Psychroserpens damuponensis TaxID=943936 RepID=UPI00058D105B|nr:hypothetical protein [Psychroserpens damuponensis]